MEKIDPLHLNNTRNDEHYQFLAEVMKLTNSVGAATLRVQPQFDVLRQKFHLEDEALKKISKSDLTQKIQDADRNRDMAFHGLLEANRATLRHFRPAVREAAERIRIVLKTYGDVSGKALAEETSAIYNLTQELTTNYEADLELTGLTEWVEELTALNRKVEQLVSDRIDQTAGRTNLVLKQVRAEVDEAYRVFTLCVEARMIFEEEIPAEPEYPGGLIAHFRPAAEVFEDVSRAAGELHTAEDELHAAENDLHAAGNILRAAAGEPEGPALYADYIRRLNLIIKRVNSLLAARRSRSANAGATPPPPEPPIDDEEFMINDE